VATDDLVERQPGVVGHSLQIWSQFVAARDAVLVCSRVGLGQRLHQHGFVQVGCDPVKVQLLQVEIDGHAGVGLHHVDEPGRGRAPHGGGQAQGGRLVGAVGERGLVAQRRDGGHGSL